MSEAMRRALMRETARRLSALRSFRKKEIVRELVDDLEERAQVLVEEGASADEAVARTLESCGDWRLLLENLEAEVMEEKMHKLRCLWAPAMLSALIVIGGERLLWALGVQPRVHAPYIDYMQTNFAMSLIYALAGATAALMSLFFDGSRRQRVLASLAYSAAMACVMILSFAVGAVEAILGGQWGAWQQRLGAGSTMIFFVAIMPAIMMGCAALPFVVYKRAPRCEPPSAVV